MSPPAGGGRPRTYIAIRATLDWADEEAFWGQLDPRVRPRVELWNATLTMPFHEFRRRVREIAALNLARVEGATLADWEEIPDGERVLPVDDDDWFDPDLVRVLDRAWGSAEIVRWNPLWLGVPSDLGHWFYATRRALLPFTPAHWTCDTNNYGLVKRPGRRPEFEGHLAATKWFARAGRGEAARIPGRYSINNRTLASQTSLRPTSRDGEIDSGRLLQRLRRYRQIYRRRRWWRDPAWSRPYVALMAELMEDVEPR
ncbi:MAG TPA: hypothetical protein VKA36_02015 [Solirubrobacterales bacterium]|nr:hypothetical protein [Solirubrobacterales bacterium]